MWFLDPAFVLVVLVAIAVFGWGTRWRRLCLVALGIYGIGLSSLYLSYLAAKPLEEFSKPLKGISCEGYEGVIALGGAIPNEDFVAERGIQLGSNAERIVEPVRLFRKCPNFQLVFTSFGKNLGEGVGESELARKLWIDLGVPSESIVIENSSTNTRENALRSSELIDLNKKWLLVTSASHMKRAVRSFEKVGVEVAAVPVDYQFTKPPAFWAISPVDGISLWRTISHEYFGFLYYKMRGWV